MKQKVVVILGLVVALSGGLRVYGLDWGTDWQTGVFHRFHTDEATLVDSAHLVGEDLKAIRASYGKAPMYLLFGVAHGLGALVGIEPFDFEDNRSVRFTHLVGRGMSALFGTLTVWLVFLIGRRLGGVGTGVLGAFFLAVCAGHIQQSHYYTVDVSLTFWVTLGLYLVLWMPSKQMWPYWAFGVVGGMAVGTRLVGVWLGVPFLMVHLWQDGNEGLMDRVKGFISPHVGVTLLAGVFLAALCEPFLILDPGHFLGESDARQFVPSMQIARGELIRIWTLYDFSTTPYLFYVTHLLRDAMGRPLEVVALLGTVWVLCRRERSGWVLMGWLLPYFLLVGGLHTKPVRYITPMLPVLVVVGAWACVQIGDWIGARLGRRFACVFPAFLVGLPALGYGVAIARIYGVEDSRIVAARWVDTHIPEGSRVMVETGGFATSWMVSEARFQKQVDQPSFFLNTEGFFLYKDKVSFLENLLRDVEWMVVIEENRMRQFEGAGARYPVGSGYYQRLRNGALGFSEEMTFKVMPEIFGLSIPETDVEPTETAFDHPRVIVYRRTGDVEERLRDWRAEVKADPRLPDSEFLMGVQAYLQSNWYGAREAFRRSVALRSNFMLGELMVVNTYFREGRSSEAKELWEDMDGRYEGVPPEVGVGMMEAGLEDDGVAYLERSVAIYRQLGDPVPEWVLRAAAEGRVVRGTRFLDQKRYEVAEREYRHALDLAPDYIDPYLGLGKVHLVQGQYDAALSVLQQALELNLNHAEIWYQLGEVYRAKGDLDRARGHFRQAVGLRPEEAQFQTAYASLSGAH